jgi:hypothetical protein
MTTDKRKDELERNLANQEQSDETDRVAKLDRRESDVRTSAVEHLAGTNRTLIDILMLAVIALLLFSAGAATASWYASSKSQTASVEAREASRNAEKAVARVQMEAYDRCVGGARILYLFNARFARPLRSFLKESAANRRRAAEVPDFRILRRENLETAKRYDRYRSNAKDFLIPTCRRP